MRTFLIDDEDALCRYLAAKEWTKNHVPDADKELQEKMRKQVKDERQKRYEADMKIIMANKCKTGQEDPRKKKKQLTDKFTETVVAEIKVGA